MYFANVNRSIGICGNDLFERFWNLPETWVEPPNQARGGTSGVICTTVNQQTVYVKKQVGHIHRSLCHPWGRPTALRELESFGILKELGITTPEPLYCESRRVAGKWHTLLATRALVGYFPISDLPQREAALSADQRREIIRAVAGTLAKLHRARLQHSALYPTHIFVRPGRDGVAVALLDLEKLRRRLTVVRASRHDIQQFLRREHCWDAAGVELFLQDYRQALAGGAAEPTACSDNLDHPTE